MEPYKYWKWFCLISLCVIGAILICSGILLFTGTKGEHPAVSHSEGSSALIMAIIAAILIGISIILVSKHVYEREL